ncbi:hypothetical protein HAX54_049731, partial [Datura stramonium]|nr:hypothetical protein [Datura stramonium]
GKSSTEKRRKFTVGGVRIISLLTKADEGKIHYGFRIKEAQILENLLIRMRKDSTLFDSLFFLGKKSFTLGTMSIATVALSPKQKLVFDGKELARTFLYEGLWGRADGNILHLVLRLSDLQAITVRTVCGQEFEFHVERKRNVGYVKQQIAKKEKGFRDLREQELILDGEELEDKRLIDDICKSNDAVLHLLVRKSAKLQEKFQVIALKTVPRSFILEPLIVNPKITLSPVVKQLIGSTFAGIARGYQPIRSSEGSGGAYFMLDSCGQNYTSVFKPIDEEPMAVNNSGLPLSVDGMLETFWFRKIYGWSACAYSIDHGYCLPENFEDCTFDWLYWPQAQQPYSAETIAYINSLDADKDIELLNFRWLTISLETLKKESIIEEIVEEAEEGVLPGTSEAAFLQLRFPLIMDRRLDDL